MKNIQVLVLDDDARFRQIVKQLLSPRGYTVLEAKSPAEADQVLADNDLSLAIIDRRLGGADGTTWIKEVRESGNSFPIIYVSAQWCDGKTFQWLRNVLKVSLILKKPIVPNLFLQQIEALLPASQKSTVPEIYLNRIESYMSQSGTLIGAPDEEQLTTYDDLLIDSDQSIFSIQEEPGPQVVIPPAPPSVPSGPVNRNAGAPTTAASKEHEDTLEEVLEQTREHTKRLRVQKRLQEMQETYAKELANEWHEMRNYVNKAVAGDAGAQTSAREVAHKLRGTAGTFGFGRVSELLGKIEDALQFIDLTEEDGADPFVLELLKMLDAGERSVNQVLSIPTQSKSIGGKLHNVLLIGHSADLEELSSQCNATTSVETVLCESTVEGVKRAATTPFDCVIVKENVLNEHALVDLCLRLRAIPGNEDIPIALIPGPSKQDVIDVIYAGVSVFAPSELDTSDDFVERIRKLINSRIRGKLRVLIVDDDAALCKFLDSLLTEHGFNVRCLTEPIEILSVMNQFQPDVVLLDVFMPGLSGYDVCRTIRENEKGAKVPVIFLTSRVSPQSRIAAFQAGGNDYLSKPVISREVLSRLRAEAEVARQHDERMQSDRAGLLTTWAFFNAAEEVLRHVDKHQPATLCYIKLDKFEQILTTHGWAIAEETVHRLGLAARMPFPAGWVRGRLGEDGILILATGVGPAEMIKVMSLFEADIKSGHAMFPEGINIEVSSRVEALDRDKNHALESAISKLRALALSTANKSG